MFKQEKSVENIYIIKSIEYIKKNLNQKIQLSDICNYINLSKYYFSRIFKEEIGVTPYKYILNCKLESAKHDLEIGLDINTIVSDYGFYDLSHFNKRFREVYGTTPLEFQKNIIVYGKSINKLIFNTAM